MILLGTEIVLKWLFLVCCVKITFLVNGEKLKCCNSIPGKNRYTDCRGWCEQASLSSQPLQVLQAFSYVYRYCPNDDDLLAKFWSCVRLNYKVLTDVEGWAGRVCCYQAKRDGCQSACQNAFSIDDLSKSCRPQDETSLYQCVRNQNGSSACCSNAYPSSCKAACRAVFATDVPEDDELQKNLKKTCSDPPSSPILQCVANYTTTISTSESMVGVPNLQCCDKATNDFCRQRCMQILASTSHQKEVIKKLSSACDKKYIENPMWQCFLISSSQDSHRRKTEQELPPIDGASLHCCSKADTELCKGLCRDVYGNQMSSEAWDKFNANCHNRKESLMNSCLQDVKEPCTVGCQGLDFCSSFNNRITESFRSCNKKADQMARHEYINWMKHKKIRLPSQTVPIKHVSECQPDMWKAIACSLQIKPCNSDHRSDKLCKSDCIHVLRECVDNSQKSYGVDRLCDLLPVSSDPEKCISLTDLTKTFKDKPTTELMNPCLANPCRQNQLCEVNPNYPSCLKVHQKCQSHVCRKACPLGDRSTFLVKVNTHALVPDIRQDGKSCYKICKCGHHGKLRKCHSSFCEEFGSCLIPPDNIIEHGQELKRGCNQCICNAGKISCSRKNCTAESRDFFGANHLALPCACSNVYSPVCASNGRTFPNPCLAKCMGVSHESYVEGNCALRNPCKDNPCGAGYKCVPDGKTCLSIMSPCPQYRCISAECNTLKHDKVCDSNGIEHSSTCGLLARRKQFGYSGHCLSSCEHHLAVCGVDGETYLNECTALASRIAVDYFAPCHTIPTSTSVSLSRGRCATVTCSRVIPPWCLPLFPPGACCPICGSILHILYSDIYKKDVMKSLDKQYITTAELASELQQFMTSRSCAVYSYLSYENEFIVLVLPVENRPQLKEVQLCVLDAQRISNMIGAKTPLLYSNFKMSVILKNTLISSHTNMTTTTSLSTTTQSFKVTVLFFMCIVSFFCSVA